jgi:hypothetical protein
MQLSIQLKRPIMNALLREAKLRDLANDLKAQGKTQAQVDRILCELRQNSFAIGLNRLVGFIQISNN